MSTKTAKIVQYRLDPANLPGLSAPQKAELAALANRSYRAIHQSDGGDIGPLTEGFLQNAERGRFYRPLKQSTTVRIDADVLAWLRSQGKGYQSRINAILRRAMLDSFMG